MKKILNPYLNKEGYNCVCCAPNNPVGLHLEFWEENEDVLTIWNPGENYQGWVNTLHGGIISMLMDEVAGWVINRKLQTTGVTMQLNVKYKKPVIDHRFSDYGAWSHRQPAPQTSSPST